MFKVIAISGNRCVGKDTLFNTLFKFNSNFKRYAFADELKYDLKQLVWEQFGIDIISVTGSQKEFIRPLLISYGSLWREKDVNHWCSKVVNQIETKLNNESHLIPVIVDLRYQNELELMRRKFGSKLFHIHIENLNSIEPTMDEKKNICTIKKLADFYLHWGNNTEEEIYDIVKNIYTQFLFN